MIEPFLVLKSGHAGGGGGLYAIALMWLSGASAAAVGR
jgi:hypothetical protein